MDNTLGSLKSQGTSFISGWKGAMNPPEAASTWIPTWRFFSLLTLAICFGMISPSCCDFFFFVIILVCAYIHIHIFFFCFEQTNHSINFLDWIIMPRIMVTHNTHNTDGVVIDELLGSLNIQSHLFVTGLHKPRFDIPKNNNKNNLKKNKKGKRVGCKGEEGEKKKKTARKKKKKHEHVLKKLFPSSLIHRAHNNIGGFFSDLRLAQVMFCHVPSSPTELKSQSSQEASFSGTNSPSSGMHP